MTERICTEDGCTSPATHYPKVKRCGRCQYRWQKEHGKQREFQCAVCGVTYTAHRKPRGKPCCSPKCRQEMSQPIATAARADQMRSTPKRPNAKQCAWCNALHFEATKFCSTECRASGQSEHARARRSPLRTAIESHDYQQVIRLVGRRTRGTESGCWEWQGAKVRSKKGSNPYPVCRVGKRDLQVHRLILEAKLQHPIGTQTAHHMCGNSMCVNPDHLQQVTSRENIAEMLARNDYIRRIAELERALAKVHPDHPLLAQAPLSGVVRAA